jgi:predicted RNase H-like HicB family nuclease
MTSFTALIDGRTGAYGLYFPDLPGCTAMGATLEEAAVNAAEAMRDWVDATIERGGAIPEPRPIEALLADPEVSADTAAGACFAACPWCDILAGRRRPICRSTLAFWRRSMPRRSAASSPAPSSSN